MQLLSGTNDTTPPKSLLDWVCKEDEVGADVYTAGSKRWNYIVTDFLGRVSLTIAKKSGRNIAYDDCESIQQAMETSEGLEAGRLAAIVAREIAKPAQDPTLNCFECGTADLYPITEETDPGDPDCGYGGGETRYTIECVPHGHKLVLSGEEMAEACAEESVS